MKNSIKNIAESISCTGCGVCACVCPNSAIKIEEDSEGFLVPVTEEEKCNGCGLCSKVCPANNKNINPASAECYAIMADSDIRRISSSGGMFTMLAREVLNAGGYVCGAAYTSGWNVHHIIINKEDDLDKLRRSKYVQSEMGDVYIQIKELLEQGNSVLFTGTPCQVSALKNFLNKNYNKLLLVDLVCHGVPNYKIFKRFLEEQTDEINDIKEINFREKERIGEVCLFSIKTNKQKIYPQEFNSGFVNNLYLRNSCTECQYIGYSRTGDITIGDFWNIENYAPEMFDNIGTSLVLINNLKGKKALDKLQGKIKIKKMPPENIDESRNHTFYHPSIVHQNRERFFKLIKKRSFYDAWELACLDKYDIGLVGCGFANNYGAILTNYALYKTIEDMNLEVLVIDKPKMLTSVLFSDYHYTNTVARKFMQKYLNLSDVYNDTEELRELNYKCKGFVAGSDQIWNNGVNNPCFYYYFMDWVFNSRKKISYASSFGNDYVIYDNDTKYNISYLLNQFDAISVREKTGIDICKNDFGVEAEQNLDPVFIVDKKHYEELIENSNFEPENKDYIAAYILDSNSNHISILNCIENELGLSSYCFTDLTNDCSNMKQYGKNVLVDADPETFLKVFKNSKFVVTNSFHGLCFAVIFNKPFICIPNRYRGYARFNSLLETLGLENRVVETIEDVRQIYNLSIDYKEVNKILEEEKLKSLSWLKSALTKEKTNRIQPSDYQNLQIFDSLKKFKQLEIQTKAQGCYINELLQNTDYLLKQNKILKYRLKIINNKSKIINKYRFISLLNLITFGKNKNIKAKYDQIKKCAEDIEIENLLGNY